MKLLRPRKYFFGYLFVRLAKTIAVGIVVLGLAFIFFKYAQATNSADAVAYRASVALDQRLERLIASFNRTSRLVAAFNSAAEGAKFAPPRFPRMAHTDADFETLQRRLAKVNQDRMRMKELVIERFDTAVSDIEKRLRDYAASLRAEASPPPRVLPSLSPTTNPAASVAPTSKEEQDTLFSKGVSRNEINDRLSKLEAVKDFLSELETKAENLENRKKLFDSITEIEALKKLLPVRIEPRVEAETSPTPMPPSRTESTRITETRTPAKAEDVANKLAAYRLLVRESMLSSWAIDDAFDECSELAGAESNKCQSESLVVSGIWLAAFGQMVVSLLASLFLAFLILVMADLTQTLLDTATNTGVMAEATGQRQL